MAPARPDPDGRALNSSKGASLQSISDRGLLASRVYPGIPPHGSGQTIGLYGGSFNPPHAGHRRVALIALRRLQLDAIWWLVSPGNPLKDHDGLAEHDERMLAAAATARHPRIAITGLERRHGLHFTADLAGFLTTRCPRTRFVWIMGGDNLAQFHLWHRWTRIADQIPMAIINRPGWLAAASNARVAQIYAQSRIDEQDASHLPYLSPPAWTYITAPRTDLSSSIIRAQ